MTSSSPHEANVAADLTTATRSNMSKGCWQSKSDEQVQLSPWTPGTSNAPFCFSRLDLLVWFCKSECAQWG